MDTDELAMQALAERLSRAEARLGPEIAEAAQAGAKFPRVIYKSGGKKGQIDHPGNITKLVNTLLELKHAEADGWQTEPIPFAYEDEPDHELAHLAVKKGKK